MFDIFLELELPEDPSDEEDEVSARHELEIALKQAFGAFAKVTGGGSGMGVDLIDIDVRDEAAIPLVIEAVRRVCRDFGRAAGARLTRSRPEPQEWII